MTPFDLPPVGLFDVLRADRCRAAEVRELYLSRSLDDSHHEHFEVLGRNNDLAASVRLTLTAKAALQVETCLSIPPEGGDHEHFDVVLERRNTSITPHSGTLRLSTV